MAKKTIKSKEPTDNILKGMVEELSSLPTEVLQQLLDNLNAIEEERKKEKENIKVDMNVKECMELAVEVGLETSKGFKDIADYKRVTLELLEEELKEKEPFIDPDVIKEAYARVNDMELEEFKKFAEETLKE